MTNTRITQGLITVLLMVLFWVGQTWVTQAEAHTGKMDQRVTELELRFARIDSKLDTMLQQLKERK
jgi:hypothetical protein